MGVKRIFITGCAHTGTTLLLRLFYAFENCEIIDWEISLWDFLKYEPKSGKPILVGKRTFDSIFTNNLRSDKIIEQIDAIQNNDISIVNISRSFDDMEHVSKKRWQACMYQATELAFLIACNVQYEELCHNSDMVQNKIIKAIPELKKENDFSLYPQFVPDSCFEEHRNKPGYGRRPISLDRIKKKENKELNIVFLSYKPCIRVIKEGVELIKLRQKVHFLQSINAKQGVLDFSFSKSDFITIDHLRDQLNVYDRKEIDLIHVHNQPSDIGYLAKEFRFDVPVIFDCHDSEFIMKGKEDEHEIKTFKKCDGFVFVSDEVRETIESTGWINGGPKVVIHTMPNKDIISYDEVVRIGGICYLGDLVGTKKAEIAPWYDYREVVKVFTDMKIPFFIYTPREDIKNEYRELGAICGGPINYNLISREIRHFDWGFVGAPFNGSAQWDKTIPNKLWDFLASGVPVIVYKSEPSAKIVREHDVGVIVDDLKEIPDIYDKHNEYREKLNSIRNKFTMDTQMPKLMSFYNEVLNNFKVQVKTTGGN